MNDPRYDLGHRRGPDFLPVAAARSEPSAPQETPPQETPPPTPRPPRAWGRAALLVAACLVAGAGAGTGAALVTARWDTAPGIRQYQPGPGGPGAVPDAQAAAEALLPSVVEVIAGNSRGSGFVIDADGHILTNSHVVEGFSRTLVRLADGSRSVARVVGADAATDVAVLALAGPSPPAAVLGVSSGLRIGQPVIAAGAPLGLGSTVTAGIVSAVDRTARLGPGAPNESPMVQTDASINPGNSGGPLANLQGQVIGMNTAIATLAGPGAGNIGIGFAVPIDRAAEVARQLIADD